MRRWMGLLGLMTVLVLGGCAVDSTAREQYKEELPLNVALTMPETLEANETIPFSIALTQDGRPAEADFVHLELFKADGSVTYGMQEATRQADGTYAFSTSVKADGLYMARIHAQANGSTVYPTKQFIVGELSEAEWASLYDGAPADAPVAEPHH